MTSKASGDDDIEFRAMLSRIGRRIDEYSLEELKYQCRDIAGPGRLEKVVTTQGLFELLEERDEINLDDVEFLLKILKNIDRIDLYKVVEEYSLTRSNMMAEPTTSIDPTNNRTELETKGEMQPKNFLFEPERTRSEQISNSAMEQPQRELNNYASPFDTSADSGGGFHVPSNRGPDTPPELLWGLEFVIKSISRGWQSAARYLNVPDSVIDSAEYNWPRNIRMQVGETFRYWARSTPAPSVQNLIAALRHVGRNDLADELELH